MVILGEQRADGAVNEAGKQDFLLGGLALTLEEAAGDLAGRVGVLAEIHHQRQEVLADFFFVAHVGGDQDDVVLVRQQGRAVRLACPAVDVDFKGRTLYFDLNGFLHGYLLKKNYFLSSSSWMIFTYLL